MKPWLKNDDLGAGLSHYSRFGNRRACLGRKIREQLLKIFFQLRFVDVAGHRNLDTAAHKNSAMTTDAATVTITSIACLVIRMDPLEYCLLLRRNRPPLSTIRAYIEI